MFNDTTEKNEKHTTVSIYKIGWGGGGTEPTGGPPSTVPPDVPVKIP